jgi:glycerol-3-phosphate acyltransferase PlsY
MGWLLVAAGYLCGSIPFGLLLAKRFAGKDVREAGSGNIGATNVARVAGKKLGAVVLVLDALKGAGPVLAARFLVDGPWWHAAVAIAAVLGHVFPPWLKFKGGKGVATAGGVLMALSWPGGVAALATWLVMAAIFRYSSLASLATCVLAPGFALIFTGSERAAVIGLVALLVILRHRENIRRLLAGEESKIKLSSSGAG